MSEESRTGNGEYGQERSVKKRNKRKEWFDVDQMMDKLKKLYQHKKPHKDKRIYVWCVLGVLFLLGIGAALYKLVFSRQAKEQEQTQSLEEASLPEIPTDCDRQEKKMKKIVKAAGGGLYFLLILCICILPLSLLWVRPAQTTVENRTMAPLPKLQTEEGFNWDFLPQAGAYFTDHFAFRQEMVSINAAIRAGIFGVSPVEDVIVGDDGWLYYAATLDDYQHKNSISERMLFCTAHNIALMQEYTQGLGKTFVFTIAPNKNSLYGEHMPKQLQFQVAGESDAQRLLPWLMRENVNYVDLFALFKEQEETLYYARDSHWTQKGAVMVYHTLLDVCGKPHETYEDGEVVQAEDYLGDLGVMLFPVGAKPERRLQYPVENTWQYVEGEKAEDQFILTENVKGEGNLLMYRDSFGNSLLPYMAQTFSQAVFSREVPYRMSDLVTYEPDILIVGKVERQLPTLGKVAPIMSAPIRETQKVCVSVGNTKATADMSREGSYWKLEGLADSAYMHTDSRIYVEVDDGSGAKLYEAFCVSSLDTENNSTNDYGYVLYLSQIQVSGDTFHIRVMTEQEEAMVVLLEKELSGGPEAAVENQAGTEGNEEGAQKTAVGTETEEAQSDTQTRETPEKTGTPAQAAQGQAGTQSQEAQGEAGTGPQEVQRQSGTQKQGPQGETGTRIQGTQGQTSERAQEVQGQTGEQPRKAQGQTGTPTKGAQMQTGTPTQAAQGQTGIPAQAASGQTGEQAQQAQAQTGAQTQEAQSQTGTPAQAAPGQTGTPDQTAQAQAQAQAQAEAQAAAQVQTAAQAQQAVTEVSRVYMEDCGSDTGYWVITYSDGHVEYLDD